MLDVGAAFTLIGDALTLNSGFADAVAGTPGAARIAVLVLILAGLSEAAGESVVLFLNRVKPSHFLRSLFISAVIFAFTYFFIAASIWTVARYGFGIEVSSALIGAVVALAQAPRLFGFLAFLPYFGLPVSVLLWIWALLSTTFGIAELMDLRAWQAAVVVALGGLLLISIQRTVGRPLLALARIMRRRAAGVDVVTNWKQLTELVDSGPDSGLKPNITPAATASSKRSQRA